ncbi:MAG TPA: tetratricopeptide repeat protein, partial [Chroococcales cyanobacterium]
MSDPRARAESLSDQERSKKTIQRVLIGSVLLIACVSIGAVFVIAYHYQKLQSNDYTNLDWFRSFKRSLGLDGKRLSDSQKNARIYEQGCMLVFHAQMALSHRDRKGAHQAFKDALDKFEQYPGYGDIYAYTCLDELATLEQRFDHFKEAERYRKLEIESAKAFSNAHSVYTARALADLASLYEEQDKYSEALPLRRQSYEIDAKGAGQDSLRAAIGLYWIAHDYWNLNDRKNAEKTILQAEQCEKLVEDDDWQVYIFQRGHELFDYFDDHQGAIEQAESFQKVLGKRNMTDKPPYVQSLFDEAEDALSMKNTALSKERLETALAALPKVYKSEYMRSLWKVYGACLTMARGDYAQAIAPLKDSLSFFQGEKQTFEITKVKQ